MCGVPEFAEMKTKSQLVLFCTDDDEEWGEEEEEGQEGDWEEDERRGQAGGAG